MRTEIKLALSEKYKNEEWKLTKDVVCYNGTERLPELSSQRKTRFLELCKDFRKLSIKADNKINLDLWEKCMIQAAGNLVEYEIEFPESTEDYDEYLRRFNLDDFVFPELTTLGVIRRKYPLSITPRQCPKLTALYLSDCNMNYLNFPKTLTKIRVGKWPTYPTSISIEDFLHYSKFFGIFDQTWDQLRRHDQGLLGDVTEFDKLLAKFAENTCYYSKKPRIIGTSDSNFLEKMLNQMKEIDYLIVNARRFDDLVDVSKLIKNVDSIESLRITTSNETDYEKDFVELAFDKRIQIIHVILWTAGDKPTKFYYYNKELVIMHTDDAKMVGRCDSLTQLSLVYPDKMEKCQFAIDDEVIRQMNLEFLRLRTNMADLFYPLWREMEYPKGLHLISDIVEILMKNGNVVIIVKQDDEFVIQYLGKIKKNIAHSYRYEIRANVSDKILGALIDHINDNRSIHKLEVGGTYATRFFKFMAANQETLKEKFTLKENENENHHMNIIHIETDSIIDEFASPIDVFANLKQIILTFARTANILDKEVENFRSNFNTANGLNWIRLTDLENRMKNTFVLSRPYGDRLMDPLEEAQLRQFVESPQSLAREFDAIVTSMKVEIDEIIE